MYVCIYIYVIMHLGMYVRMYVYVCIFYGLLLATLLLYNSNIQAYCLMSIVVTLSVALGFPQHLTLQRYGINKF
jgi:hypothetical protein